MSFNRNTEREIFILREEGMLFHRGRAPGKIAISTGAYFHTHNFPEITYIVEGSGFHITEDKEYELKKNNLILTPPGIHHKIKIDPDKIYDRFYIGIDPDVISDMDIDSIYKSIVVVDCSENSVITDIFKRADYYAKKFDEKNFSNITRLLVKELFYNLGIFENVASVKSRSLHPVLLKAIEYINKNFLTISSVKEVSDSLFVTERYLFELFKTQLTISPKKYINEKRLYYAQQLILKGKKPSEVYYEAGFSDYSTFYRGYINYFGHSPSKEERKLI